MRTRQFALVPRGATERISPPPAPVRSPSVRLILAVIVFPFLVWHGLACAEAPATKWDISEFITTDPAIRAALKFELYDGGEILKDERFQNSRILKITGIDKDDMYGAWIRNVKPEPGKLYRLSVFSRTTKGFPDKGGPLLMVFFFKDPECNERLDVKYINLPTAQEWRLTSQILSIPAGTDNVAIGFRMSGQTPKSEALECARFQLESLSPLAGLPEITFEHWETAPRPEATLGASCAKVRRTTIGTSAAHSGESYLEIEGVGKPDQRDFTVGPLLVAPRMRYDLSFFGRMATEFPQKQFIVMILQYDAARAKLLKADYWTPFEERPLAWTRAEREVVTEDQAEWVLIVFRLESAPTGQKLLLDDIAMTLKSTEPVVFLLWEIEPRKAILSGKARVSGAAGIEGIIVSIIHGDQTLKEQKLATGQEDFSFDLHDLTDNVKYYVTATANLADGRKVQCQITDKDNMFHTYVKHRPWEGNGLGLLGKDDPPPAPWTPLRYDAAAQTVRTWNNILNPGTGLGSLRVSFLEQKDELNDIALSLNGRRLDQLFRFSPTEAPHVSPNRVVLSSAGKGEGVDIQTTFTVEFEGLIHEKLVLQPEKGRSFKVDNLTLTVRFPRDYVQFCYAKDGLTLAPTWRCSEYYPAFWFGNYDSGLLWCGNRIYPTVRHQERDWIALAAKDGASVLTVNLVNKPIEIRDAPLIVEFGLLPTPIRPFQMRTRTAKFRTGEDATLSVTATMPCLEMPFFGYPEVTTPEAFRAYVAQQNFPKADMLFYFGTSYAMETIPQMTYFKKEWISVPSNSYTTDHPAYKGYASGSWTTVDMGNSSWTDLCLFKLKPFLEQTGIKGVYNDAAWPSIQERDGDCFCPVFEAQDFHRRMYVLLHRIVPDAWIISHQGLATALPWAAFSDFVMNGEHLYNQLRAHTYYLEFMSLPELRATLAAPLGPAHMLLQEYSQEEKRQNKALMSQTAGLAMLNGAQMWLVPGLSWQEPMVQMVRRKFAFGDLASATWYPYWQKNPYLHGDNPAVAFSFYERNGDMFVILVNTTDKRQRIVLNLLDDYTMEYPGRKSAVLYHPAEMREEVRPLEGGKLIVELGPYLPELITVKQEERVGRFLVGDQLRDE